MSNYHESVLAFMFLETVLGGDSTLTGYAPGGVWRSMAPPGTATPFVIIARQAGTDVVTMNGVRLITDQLYQVRAVGPATSSATIALAAARADRLLGGPPGAPVSGSVIVSSVQEGQILSCYREQQIMLDEIINGELWTNIGGLYRIIVEQVAS
jgi:hypothetical protein